MSNNQLKELLDKYHLGQCTPDEVALLESWYTQLNASTHSQFSETELAETEKQLWSKIGPATRPVRKIKPKQRLAIAASLLLAFCIGAYFLLFETKQVPQVKKTVLDLAPGTNKAFISLADGSIVPLSGIANQKVLKQGATEILIIKSGMVTYRGSETGQSNVLNTLHTPRGGQYALTLSDGTKAWLDAASSITYPVAFNGATREVSITGQVYFEVAHNAAKPFRVSVKNETIEVLGTHFNVNAYNDEPTLTTTLLQGQIKLSLKGGESKLMHPGEQGQVTNSRLAMVDQANVEEAVAWHNNMFKFNEASIPQVMRQLSRWYNVDIIYEGKIPDTKFSGELYRNVSALKISDILSYANIHFHIKDKKIIVTP